MSIHRDIALISVMLCCCIALGLSLDAKAGKVKSAPPIVKNELTQQIDGITLQPGTYLLAVAESYIRTDMNVIGDPVEARLVNNVYVANRLVLGEATRLYGHIDRMEQPLEGKDAVLAVEIDKIELPSGELIPVKAYLETDNEDHSWGGGLREGTVPTKVQHRVMGIGRYNKTVMMGPRKMGRHYQIQPGEYWRVVLQTPVTIPLMKWQ